MTTTYERAPAEVLELVERAKKKWHKRLVEHDVALTVVVARGSVNEDGEIASPAIKHHGVRALGLCSLVKLRERVLGLGDVLITLDGDHLDDVGEAEALALIDHELEHIEVVLEMRSTDGKVSEVKAVAKRDDAGRPVLRLRLHDRQFGWFDSVAKRHGAASEEVQQAQRWADEPRAAHDPSSKVKS